MSKPKVLLQLDVDDLPSSFDSLVAIDSGVHTLLPYAGVNRENVTGLVHGAIFTRGPSDLKNSAIFIGGSDVSTADDVFHCCKKAFFGPLRVSLMCDPNGSNTTAAAAALCVERHLPLNQANLVVLGGAGPVGSRIARIAAARGAAVRICSRDRERAKAIIAAIRQDFPQAQLDPYEYIAAADIPRICAGYDVLIAAGAAGTPLTNPEWMEHVPGIRIAVDLNAVPPAGLLGVDAKDANELRSGITCYGALGVGALKMKIHKACLRQLFESNDRTFETATIYELGRFLETSSS